MNRLFEQLMTHGDLMKEFSSWQLMLSLLILLIAPSQLLSQLEPNADEIKLAKVFSDDFSKDSRTNYKTIGEAKWNRGELALSPGSRIERLIDGGPWADVEIKTALVDASAAASESEIRIWFMLEKATDCCVVFRRTIEDEKMIERVQLVDTNEQDGKIVEKVIKEANFKFEDADEIRASYRNGLIQVAVPSGSTFVGYVENGDATVQSIAVSTNQVEWILKSFGSNSYRQKKNLQTDIEKQQLGKLQTAEIELSHLYGQGNLAKSIEVCEEILKIKLTVFGKLHPSHDKSLNDLAALNRKAGRYARAAVLYKRVLDTRKVVYGEQHPQVAVTANILGLLYHDMGDYARSEPLLQIAENVWNETLGQQHPKYGVVLNNLGLLYTSMGEYARAESILKRSLSFQKDLQEIQPEQYAGRLENLALLYVNQGEYARAEPLFKKALSIWKDEKVKIILTMR